MRSIESMVDAWVGLRSPRPGHVIEAAGFMPDDPDQYCARCGSTVGEGEAGSSGCATCRSRPIHSDRFIRLGRHEGDLRQWLLGVKYECWAEMGRTLGRMLGEQIESHEPIDADWTIIVPVPMPWQRRLFRGIDHTRVIAGAAATRLHIPLFSILRKINGPTQVSLAATERRRNLRGRIGVRRRIGGWPLEDLCVILVDDIRTTGATMNASGRILRDLGAARIIAATIAVTDETARRGKSAQNGKEDDPSSS